MPIDSFSYRFDVDTSKAFRLLGNVSLHPSNSKTLVALLASICDTIVSPNKYRIKAFEYDTKLYIEANNYKQLKKVLELIYGDPLNAFEINHCSVEVMNWLRSKPNAVFKIMSVFEKDLSIILDDPNLAMEFKLKFPELSNE